ncbi:CBS domain-containing protein [Thermofilum pendens]|uniref:Uncharacterized 33.4 kDa protein in ribosomal RNA operon n=2 Tax=Thermofilum pendens TaxID=2269 RepID=YR33_THEPE|nr:CBS domain-containing protein [Thermofilum pendens]P15889.1 RecName: Full=Uncharacterized 33.4 kDa protein in ribosomal RNA operon [Thermofilum pendens]CAA32944.1 unnamed protein product [Thermofilum pendens]
MRVSELPVGRFPPLAVVPSSSRVLDVLVAMGRNRVRHVPLVDERGVLKGMVSARDLVDFLGGRRFRDVVEARFNGDVYKALEQTGVEFLKYDPPYVYTRSDLREVIELMVERGIGALAVVDEDLRVVGIVSERHVISLLANVETHVKVKEIMTSEVVYLSPMDSLFEGMRVMSERRIRRLPLVSGEELRGIVTIKDVLSYVSREDVLARLKEGSRSAVYDTPLVYISSKPVLAVEDDVDVGLAVSLMKKHGIGALVVTHDGKPRGIVTERDVLTRLPRVKGVEIFLDEATKTIFGGRVTF